MAEDQARGSGRARTRRRAVLTGAALGAVALGAPEAANATPEVEKREEPKDPRQLSYRETDHIQQYYARARL